MGFRTLFDQRSRVTAYPLTLCILPASIALNESKQLFTDGVLRVH